jgi:N-acetylmuramoyl-L-alanine amidase
MRISNQVGKMRLENLRYSLSSICALVAALCVSCSSLGGKKESTVTAQRTNTNENQTVNQNQVERPLTAVPTPPRPKIISRQEWMAKDAIGKMQLQAPQRITIHHTASPQKEEVTIEKKMQTLQNFSQSESRLASGKNKPAWPDVPYHYYIAVDGQIAEGRDIKYVGDTNTDYDPSGHILIVLEGNFENEQVSSKQLESLIELVAWLSAKYEIPVSEIKAHNDYASTACPGVNLKNALPALRQKVAEIRGIVDKK